MIALHVPRKLRPVLRALAAPILMLLLGVGAARAATATSHAATDPSGHWEGAIQLPGMPLVVRVDFASKDGAWTGKIDIPQQNASGLLLDPVLIAGTTVKFALHGIPGDPHFDGNLGDGRIDGTFTQGALAVPFALTREKLVVQHKRRPQEPDGPLPYVVREVQYDGNHVHFAGTLTIPPTKPPFPAVLLITGSGAQDRNEDLGPIINHRPFLVLADRLTRAGIVVLRVDDRGVGGTTGGKIEDATTEDFANDALAGVAFLDTVPEVDPTRVGLVGHSEGADAAVLAATRSDSVAFVVMLAGTGVVGEDLILEQELEIAHANNAPVGPTTQQAGALRSVLDLIQAGADDDTVREKIRQIVQEQMQRAQPDHAPDPAAVQKVVDEQARVMLTPWYRFFIRYDPRPALRKLRVPVLLLIGEKDLQVPPDQNIPPIESALKESGDPDVTIRRLPGLNHLFQSAGTGSPQEYGKIEETFNEGAMNVIRDWILQRFGSHPTTSK